VSLAVLLFVEEARADEWGEGCFNHGSWFWDKDTILKG
jgi:hypothetical protein